MGVTTPGHGGNFLSIAVEHLFAICDRCNKQCLQWVVMADKHFYESLYSKNMVFTRNEIREANGYFFNTVPLHKLLGEEEKAICEQDISLKELVNAIKDLPNNKSLGSDGFPIEFYKFFWPDIKETVIESFLYDLQKGKLSIEQRKGVLTLISKKDKDIHRLKKLVPYLTSELRL